MGKLINMNEFQMQPVKLTATSKGVEFMKQNPVIEPTITKEQINEAVTERMKSAKKVINSLPSQYVNMTDRTAMLEMIDEIGKTYTTLTKYSIPTGKLSVDDGLGAMVSQSIQSVMLCILDALKSGPKSLAQLAILAFKTTLLNDLMQSGSGIEGQEVPMDDEKE